MLKTRKLRNLAQANRANLLYQRGDEAWRKGQLRSAFKDFLAAARAGMAPAFRIVGQFYHRGDGVKADLDAALYWYRLASRNGEDSAANNIGCIWRDRGKLGRALRWFERATRLGDADANINIAKIYLRKGDLARAHPYLTKACRSPWTTEQTKHEAKLLLGELKANRTGRVAQPRAAGALIGRGTRSRLHIRVAALDAARR